jgi:hypothetical protein
VYVVVEHEFQPTGKDSKEIEFRMHYMEENLAIAPKNFADTDMYIKH